MRRLAIFLLTVAAIMVFAATRVQGADTWKLVLKTGRVVECDGAPLIVDGVYTFRQKDGTPGSIPAEEIDREKTDRANDVDRRQWRPSGGLVTRDPGSPAARPTSDIISLHDADFEEQVIESPTPVMVEFWASWCGWCKRFEPTMQAIASEFAGRVRMGRLNIDSDPGVKQRYDVHHTPTLLLFKQGRVVGTIHGFVEKAEVAQMLREHL